MLILKKKKPISNTKINKKKKSTCVKPMTYVIRLKAPYLKKSKKIKSKRKKSIIPNYSKSKINN